MPSGRLKRAAVAAPLTKPAGAESEPARVVTAPVDVTTLRMAFASLSTTSRLSSAATAIAEMWPKRAFRPTPSAAAVVPETTETVPSAVMRTTAASKLSDA